MVKKPNYEGWTEKDYQEEIEALKKQKTYGLIWERDKTKEVFDYYLNWDGTQNKEIFKEAEAKFPVLREVKDNEITTDKNADYNILIEGDNYHALATLNFTHANGIDVIYIDPPYNTGNNDFKYNDKWVDKEDAYRHSKWLSFMEKRLRLAKNLLNNSGVIFISIDDNELAQLKILGDELFDEKNFVANFIWRKKRGGGRGNSLIIPQTEYILCYAKNINNLDPFTKELSDYKIDRFKYEDSWGKYSREGLDHHSPKGAYERKTLQYDLVIDSKKIYCPTGQWLWSKDRVDRELSNYIINDKGEKEYKYLDLVLDKNNRWRAFKKIRLEDETGQREETILSFIDDPAITNNSSAFEIKKIFGEAKFNYAKPSSLIKYLLKSTKKESTILDYFAGTGTTGHAILELNKEDGGNRKFILCTNNEANICTEVCYPRIEKVINGYKTPDGEKIEGLGGNLRYFKTDFVDSAPTAKNKKKIVDKSTEMICIKENAFKPVKDGGQFKIFKNSKTYLGIVFESEAIEDFVKEAKKMDGRFNVYVFSLDDTVPEKEFKELKGRVSLCPIPEAILHVYRRVFKDANA